MEGSNVLLITKLMYKVAYVFNYLVCAANEYLIEILLSGSSKCGSES